MKRLGGTLTCSVLLFCEKRWSVESEIILLVDESDGSIRLNFRVDGTRSWERTSGGVLCAVIFRAWTNFFFRELLSSK